MSDAAAHPDQGPPGEYVVVAWRRDEAGLTSRHDFVNRWSKHHVVHADSGRALCGTKVLWSYVGSGDGTRCTRCHEIAAARGLRNEDGLLIGPSIDA